ncbi:SMP-30/gluconolactonase/LRE family protein [Sphingobium algorifonticola]|uniref:SMP-30/gluconolactonase/LRE family protein n=2 Tax=Sphingobium algorifonticola TaxID=2008318 RepID=A0A437J3N3_9SPHN|nr:SMP-30/gluconolactonase/LRE family protein [Sphingobium algorifonticola]
MGRFEVLATGLKFPEGPIPMADGSVLFVEIARGTLSRLTRDGNVEIVAETGGGPNGAAIGPDGKVYVCNNGGFEWHDVNGALLPGLTPADYAGGSIQRVDLATGVVETLYTHCNGERLKGPNDIVFDAHGGFWFTDNGKRYARTEDVGAVYYALCDGSFISEQVYPRSHPNGIGMSPDGATLYVSETMSGRIWRYAVPQPGMALVPQGLLNAEALLYGAGGFELYDSLAVEAGGNICVAALATGGIRVISPEGETVEFVETGDPVTTNIAFGGPDMQTAYLTLSGVGHLIAMRWARPGLRLAFNG